MRSKHVLVVVSLLTLGFVVGRLSVTPSLAASGTLDSPAPPGSTFSYTLEDIYNRLAAGTAGAQSAFTEPTSGPTTGTGRTLNEIMAQAPAADNTNGATAAEVLAGKTFWGLNVADLAWGPLTGTYPFAAVPKTGQTTSYGTRDDGALEKGVTWPSPRFTDNGDGTVTDNLTRLIWLKNANCFGARTWTAALSDANGLAAGSCGLTDGSSAGDWRLSNMLELKSLIDYSVVSPGLPNTAGTGKWSEGDPFTGVTSDSYWSSTTYADDTVRAGLTHLANGASGHGDKTSAHYVWPVRGGQ